MPPLDQNVRNQNVGNIPAPIKGALMAGIACILSTTIACRNQAVIATRPTNDSKPAEQRSMKPDQVNSSGWDKAWTNLLSVAEQSFTPSLPKLLGVEVEVIVGNPGEAEGDLTLTIVDANDQALAVVTQKVQAATPTM